jgi:hypothetical protein
LAGYDGRWLRGDLIAHELGQVGDILAVDPAEVQRQIYPTVDVAVAGVGSSQAGP